MTEMYNRMAELCAEIVRSCPDEAVFMRYGCLSDERRDKILQDLSQRVPALVGRTLQKNDLNDSFYAAWDACTAALRNREDRFAMIALAQTADKAMQTLLLEKIRSCQNDDFSVVLNTNRESTGIGLLPRCSCLWERKHRLSHSYHRLDNFLYHFLLIENRILGEWIDKHIFLPDPFFPGFSERKELVIGATPLRGEKHFEEIGYTEQDIRFFTVQCEPETEKQDNEEIWQKIQKASKQHCNILVFPEVLGNPATPEFIRQKLLSLSPEEQQQMPSLIVLPSVWENHMNTVTVLDRSGNLICRQSKQTPFCLTLGGKKHLEGIHTNQVVTILHYEGIGRIAILICKDFLNTRYMEQLMRCFKLTLMIVPSYSTGSYDFRQSFDVCAHDDCNVIWINTCAAVEEGKEANFRHIGYVRKRIGRNDDDSQKLCEMPSCEGFSKGICRRDCLFFETIKGV